MKRWLGPVVAVLLVAASWGACSSSNSSKVEAACQKTFHMEGPAVPTTIPESSANDLLGQLEQVDTAGNPALAADISALRSAVRSGNGQRIIDAVGNFDGYYETHNTGATDIT